jgi:hypothetical protein
MQHPLDAFTIELQVIPECDCGAHGLVIQHAATCKGFANELTAGQVHDLAAGFVELYDAMIVQGKQRRRLTKDGRAAARRAIPYADLLLGTQHRYV